MAFEFGMFHEFQRREGQTEAEAFTEAFAQVDAAERWGSTPFGSPRSILRPSARCWPRRSISRP